MVLAESRNWEYVQFAFDVRDGYRITSMTLTGTITGVLKPGVPRFEGTIGEANNKYSMDWNFSHPMRRGFGTMLC